MRVLLLGGSGFVGRHLLGGLLADSRHRVMSPQRRDLDVADYTAGLEALASFRPDVVVNATGATGIGVVEGHSPEAQRLNHLAPEWWADVCAQRNVKFVHFSTDQVFDGLKCAPYLESDPTNGVSVYGKTKAAGEKAVVKHHCHLIVRTSFVFGSGGNNFMSRLPALLLGGDNLRVVKDIKASCVHVRTLSKLTLLLIEAHAVGIVNVVNAGEVSWPEFASACVADIQTRGIQTKCADIVTVPYRDLREHLGPRAIYSVLSHARVDTITGNPVRHWREEIPEFINDFQLENGNTNQ